MECNVWRSKGPVVCQKVRDIIACTLSGDKGHVVC